MTKYLPPERLQHLMWNQGEVIPISIPRTGSSLADGQYILMPQTANYALGVHALRDACNADPTSLHPQYVLPDGSAIYRPLTFKETIEARVNSYESTTVRKERLALFSRWNNSCTGAVYKAGTTRFRLVPQSLDLITIASDFNEAFLPIVYDMITEGTELESSEGIYNVRITKAEIEVHVAWLEAVEQDVVLLRNYRDIVFEELKERSSKKEMPEKAMGFWIRQDTPTDELRTLFVNSLGGSSGASGGSDLDGGGSFVRVAQRSAP